MGKGYLIDTNTIIDFQIGIVPQAGHSFVSEIIDNNFVIPFISYIEYLAYDNVAESMLDFISLANVIEVNKAIIDETIDKKKI